MINRYGWKIVSLGAAILTLLLAVPADSATLKANRVDVEYVPPKSSAHDCISWCESGAFWKKYETFLCRFVCCAVCC